MLRLSLFDSVPLPLKRACSWVNMVEMWFAAGFGRPPCGDLLMTLPNSLGGLHSK